MDDFDGQKAASHAMPTAMDIWSFSPFEPDEMANKTRKSRVLDVHTVHNTWIGSGGSTAGPAPGRRWGLAA